MTLTAQLVFVAMSLACLIICIRGLIRRIQRNQRIRSGKCDSCGYPTAPATLCPECGKCYDNKCKGSIPFVGGLLCSTACTVIAVAPAFWLAFLPIGSITRLAHLEIIKPEYAFRSSLIVARNDPTIVNAELLMENAILVLQDTSAYTGNTQEANLRHFAFEVLYDVTVNGNRVEFFAPQTSQIRPPPQNVQFAVRVLFNRHESLESRILSIITSQLRASNSGLARDAIITLRNCGLATESLTTELENWSTNTSTASLAMSMLLQNNNYVNMLQSGKRPCDAVEQRALVRSLALVNRPVPSEALRRILLVMLRDEDLSSSTFANDIAVSKCLLLDVVVASNDLLDEQSQDYVHEIPHRRKLMEVLQKMFLQRLSEIDDIMTASDYRSRTTGCWLIGSIGNEGKRFMELLRAAAKDNELPVRLAAERALRRLGSLQASEK